MWMRIKWHGHSCFEFDDGNVTVVIDPHDGKSMGIKPPYLLADVVLITHDHYDHNASRSVRGQYREYKSQIGRFESKGIQFRGLESFHDGVGGELRGPNTVYVFEMDGMTVCHCGDLGAIPSQKALRHMRGCDFMFLPVGGVYTLDLPELRELIMETKPHVIVPMHYRTGGLTIPVMDVEPFLEMLPGESVLYVGNTVDIVKEEMPLMKECWVFDL